MLNVFRRSREPIVSGPGSEGPVRPVPRIDRGPPRMSRRAAAGGVALFLAGSAAWGVTTGSPWPPATAIVLTITVAGLNRGTKVFFNDQSNFTEESALPNPEPKETQSENGGLGMAKQQRRGKLAQIPQERLDRYASFFDAEWQRIQMKAKSLVGNHNSHRASGSCSLHHNVEEIMSEGFLRVLHDPKDTTTPKDFAHDMFRQMEGYLNEQRRRAASRPGRHEPIDDENPQQPSTVVHLPSSRPDEEYEQRHALERARKLLEDQMPRLLPLFELTRLNLSVTDIADRLSRTPEQVYRDRHTLLQFLRQVFNSGEQP